MTLPDPELITFGEYWALDAPYRYVTANVCEIIVPRGFLTDGCSSPFHIVITRWGGHYSGPVVIHDYLYDALNGGAPHPCAPTRAAADRIFYQACKEAGVNWATALLMFAAVRVFGGMATRRLFVETMREPVDP